MNADSEPAKFGWLPPALRPPVPTTRGFERILLLVGAAALFAGYAENVFQFVIPQVQAELHIPENQIGLTVAYFRLAAGFAMLLAASADLIGRRRLLLCTILGQAIFTLLTAFAGDYVQFVWAQVLTRVFGYAEEMLCFVVIAEEIGAGARGWSNGMLIAMYYLGAGVASLVFAAINILPFGWRAVYVAGAIPLFLVGYMRRNLPETKRFTAQANVQAARSKWAQTCALLRDIAREYPGRIVTILIACSALGFAISPATVLAQKYLQSVYHYSPGQVTMLLIPGGLLGLVMAIAAGRLSDKIGRKPVAIATITLSGVCFYFFYSSAPVWAIPPLWVLAFLGFFSGDVLVAGFALEIVPTHYRATVSGLRYLVEISAGAISLALEGRLYDHFHAHGPAIQLLLAAIPIALIAILFLPEPAGKSLEDMTGATPS